MVMIATGSQQIRHISRHICISIQLYCTKSLCIFLPPTGILLINMPCRCTWDGSVLCKLLCYIKISTRTAGILVSVQLTLPRNLFKRDGKKHIYSH